MMWRMRRRSRAICLSLALVSIFFHLLLAFVSLSMYRQACDPPIPTSMTFSKHLANKSFTAVAVLTESPLKRDSPGVKGRGGAPLDKFQSRRIGLIKASFVDPLGSSLAKLQALFEHPLYKAPMSAIQQDDMLLRVLPKMKSERSSQMWVSASQEGYENVRWNTSGDSHPPWLRFHLTISRWQLYPHPDPNMESVIQQLATHRIVSAVQKSGGTQLKLVMSFPNYGQAMFKPMKQDRNDETNYNLYYFSDFERHNAEIAAFHLDRILGYRRVPPVVGRKVDVVKEIKDITTDHKLARTFFNSPVGNVCFYGRCSYYCSTEHAVCGRPTALEASLALMLPDLSLATRRSWRSPWRRSYSRSKLAKWETEPDYCTTIKKTAPYDKGTRLVDFIDMVILDFLMSNMDRHHYETFEKFGNDTFLLHLDNGRAFGRHSKDEPSILVPLEQCCRIRRSTWLRLRLLSLPQYRLSDVMRASLSHDPLHGVAPLLTEPHLSALDRRLKTITDAVSRCLEKQSEGGVDEVIYDDVGQLEVM
ncbi:extracellular serine/threonine protein kinase FAM20C-like isoform X1 [Syngnathus typhle]|uniref:extracellular serine/threonine protein kinase FAM20C-like isoform X1 n=1 Tax=Syngnathus typhle TaxID=161592 RepID=UPI002A6A6472|nr:extracellular serine/threonine protein kinase FAM20C-like isoform X1 [Syngnathus typhle]XP_061130717.1 extracellular serine/threonine protein kinase FAM20C-like isoform X1 [Syngnathus typhle]